MSTCPECDATTVPGARFCGRCGAVLEGNGGAGADDPRPGTVPPPTDDVEEVAPGRVAASRRRGVALGAVVALAVLLVVTWPSSTPPAAPGPGDRSGVDTPAALPARLGVRWDVPVPGSGGPTSAGRPPARVGEDATAVADVVVGADGAVSSARPPGVLADGVWAVAGSDGLVLGDAATGQVTAVRPWPSSTSVTPVGPALAWVPAGGGSSDPVVAVAEGGAVRLGPDLEVRWRSPVVPMMDATAVASGRGPLVPARRAGSADASAVLDLRDGRVLVRTSGDLRLLAVGHGLALTADERDVVAAWVVPDDPVALPGDATPAWEMSLRPGRPVGVDVLSGDRLALHAVDAVVGEVRLVDATDGTMLDIIAGWPNSDLDGGRTAEAFDDVVVGVVGDVLRRFTWDGTRLPPVQLDRIGWFVTSGDRLVQLVSRRGGEVLLVTADGEAVPAAAPPPTPGVADRVVRVVGDTVGIGGFGQVRWVDARTGELDVPPPPGARDGDPPDLGSGDVVRTSRALVGRQGQATVALGDDGEVIWRRSGVTPVVAVGEGVVVRGEAGSDLAGLQLLDRDGGTVTALHGAMGIAGPLDGAVVLVEPGAVAVVSQTDGTERWRTALPALPALANLDGDVHPGLVVTPRHVVVPLADGTLVALRREDGRLVWAVPTGVATEVVGAGEEVVVATVDGALLRVAPDGVVTPVANLAAAAVELAVVGDVVLALLPGRLVGVAPPGGPLPDEDRVELGSSRPLSAPGHPMQAGRWHAARARPSTSPGG